MIPKEIRDTPDERRRRALIGRRGCREAVDVSDRLAILAYVVWHQDSLLVEQQLHLNMSLSPGIVASHMAYVFRREFAREAERAVVRKLDYEASTEAAQFDLKFSR